jgi:hypothetical protein
MPHKGNSSPTVLPIRKNMKVREGDKEIRIKTIEEMSRAVKE